MKTTPLIAIFIGTFVVYAILSNQVMLYYVVTGSMEPNIPVGSLVVVVPDKFLSIGDVAAFRRADATILHRVAEIHENYLLMSADAYPDFREIVTWDMIVGKMVLAIPLLGYAYMLLVTPAGASFAFTVLVLILFLRGDRNLGFWPAALSALAMTAVGLNTSNPGQYMVASTLAATALSTAVYVENRFADGKRWAELAYIAVFTASVLLIFRADLRWLFT